MSRETPLWLRAIDAKSRVVTVRFDTLSIELLVRPYGPAEAIAAHRLTTDLVTMLGEIRALTEGEVDALTAATRAARADGVTEDDRLAQADEWRARAYALTRSQVREVRDPDSGEWAPLLWAETEEEAIQADAEGSNALMLPMLSDIDLCHIIAAARGPAEEVAGVITRFPGRRGRADHPGSDGAPLRPEAELSRGD